MKTRILLSISLLLAVSAPTLAQNPVQRGYVKSLGRPEKKGEALANVTVRVKGVLNAVTTGNDGNFAVVMQGKKNGDAYALQQVQKNGYELNEKGVIGRQYAFSDKVPLTVVMVSTKQLEADKLRIENKAYEVARKNYKAKFDALNKAQEEGTVAAEEYRKQLQEQQDKFEKYQCLIDGLAEHYAHVDYDFLDDKEREINISIENGELDKADSIIHTLFDPTDVLERNVKALEAIDKQSDEGYAMLRSAYDDLDAVLKQQEKDAEHLYQLYTIALARFDNEKARQYIETRAALDTTNVQWQYDAGQFVQYYLTKYDKAFAYYQLVLRQSLLQFGEDDDWTASAYNNIGVIYSDQGRYNEALEFYGKAQAIWLKVFSEGHPQVAILYNNIGVAYHRQGKYTEALEFHNKALAIRLNVFGGEQPCVAQSYTNIGNVYFRQGKYVEALDCYEQGLVIFHATNGKEHPDVAISYNNIGNVCSRQGKYAEALEYYKRALAIDTKIYGEGHPNVADSYCNLGSVYSSQGNYTKALEYYGRAFAIYLKVYGEEHSRVATLYNNNGVVYEKQNKYAEALENHEKALTIRKNVLGEEHTDVADSYNNIGLVYKDQGKNADAQEYYEKALAIYKKAHGEGNPDVASAYNNIGNANYRQGRYAEALENLEKALAIRKNIYDEDHVDVATSYNNIAAVYKEQGRLVEALEYFEKAYGIYGRYLPKDNPTMKMVEGSIEYCKQKLAEQQ